MTAATWLTRLVNVKRPHRGWTARNGRQQRDDPRTCLPWRVALAPGHTPGASGAVPMPTRPCWPFDPNGAANGRPWTLSCSSARPALRLCVMFRPRIHRAACSNLQPAYEDACARSTQFASRASPAWPVPRPRRAWNQHTGAGSRRAAERRPQLAAIWPLRFWMGRFLVVNWALNPSGLSSQFPAPLILRACVFVPGSAGPWFQMEPGCRSALLKLAAMPAVAG